MAGSFPEGVYFGVSFERESTKGGNTIWTGKLTLHKKDGTADVIVQATDPLCGTVRSELARMVTQLATPGTDISSLEGTLDIPSAPEPCQAAERLEVLEAFG